MRIMRRICGILALCALGVALISCAGNNPPQPPIDPAQKCAALKIAADLACQPGNTNPQICTASALAFTVTGCGVYVAPTPPPPPPSCKTLKCPPSAEPGEVEKTQCLETAAGPACVKPTTPPPTPVCPTCPTGYHCSDPKVGCVKDDVVPPPVTPPVSVYLDDDKLTIKPGDDGKQTWSAAWAALTAVETKYPELFNAEHSGVVDRGASGYDDDIDNVYQLMAVELKAKGIDGGSSKSASGQISDCIFIQRKGTNEYEENHLFEYGGGKHATGPGEIKGVYIYSGSTTPNPPPVATSCPFEPCPARVWTAETLPPGWGDDQLGKPTYVIGSKPHTMGNCDSTPVVQRQCDFCKAVDLGCQDSNPPCNIPRCGCSVRVDGHPERVAVENWLLFGGPKREGRNGKDCTPNNTDNPFAYLNDPDCRLCNSGVGPLKVCTTQCGGSW